MKFEPSPARWAAAFDDSAGGDAADPAGRRKRGRFSFLGSASGSLGEAGEAVARLLTPDRTSCAFSKAFQARSSSCDSGSGRTAGCSTCACGTTMPRRRAFAPRLSAASKRCCHILNSRRCCGVLVSRRGSSSCSKGKSRSICVPLSTSCQTRAQDVSCRPPRRRAVAAGGAALLRGRRRSALPRPGSSVLFSMSITQFSQYQTSGASSKPAQKMCTALSHPSQYIELCPSSSSPQTTQGSYVSAAKSSSSIIIVGSSSASCTLSCTV